MLRFSTTVELFGSSIIVGVWKVYYKKNAGTTENTPNSPMNTTGSIYK